MTSISNRLSPVVLLLIVSFISSNVTAQTPSSLSDEFGSQESLSEWQRFYEAEGWPDMMESIWIEDGELRMQPFTAGWYADFHAPFLFKLVSGDFRVTTRLLTTGRDGSSPDATWSLSGLMVREPRDVGPSDWTAGGEDWLFLTTGVANDINQPVFETKTTINSRSALELHPNRLEWVELAIERSGAVFSLQYRYDGEEWTEIEEFKRPDLPETLQVGLNAYTDYYSAPSSLFQDPLRYNQTVVTDGSPDLLVRVDYVRFEDR